MSLFRTSSATAPLADTPQTTRRPVIDGLLPLARRHRGPFGQGLLFSALLVGARLALPLPLTRVVDLATAGPASAPPARAIGLLSVAFVALALVAGVAEHYERLAFAHFAGRTVSDARTAALLAVPDGADRASADLTAQILGDCTRVKQGLKGVLNHITVSGMLMIGVCAALLVTDRRVGLVVATGTVVLCVVSVAGARRVGAIAAQHRRREVTIAATVHRLVDADRESPDTHALAALVDLDGASGDADIAMTRWEGVTTWVVHIVLVVTSAVALLVALHATETGQLGRGTLFAVLTYLLVLQGPAVRCARQITRTAPLLVSARELGRLLVPSAAGHR